jgi:hypothetical protein
MISVGGLATAGVLVAAGAAVNRLFRPFDATVPRPERVAEPLVLTIPTTPRVPVAGLGSDQIATAALPRQATSVRPASAVLTRRGGSRRAWRCI